MTAQLHRARAVTAARSIRLASPEDPFRVLVARPEDDFRINTLRQTAYAKAGYFSIPDTSLLQRQRDPATAVCLIIANKKQIAATVRLCLATHQSGAERLLQGPAPLAGDHFPTLTLCRGATSTDFRGLGLMTFLVGLGVAVADRAGLNSATGMQAEGTPHFGTMLASGWQSKDVPSAATECVRMKTDAMKLVFISRARFGYSASYGQNEHGDLYKALQAVDAIETAAQRIARIHQSQEPLQRVESPPERPADFDPHKP